MADTRKTSDEFQGATGDYATYTNDVDKPYPLAKPADDAAVPEIAEAVDPPAAESFYAEPKGDDHPGPRGGEKMTEPKAETKRPAAKASADK